MTPLPVPTKPTAPEAVEEARLRLSAALELLGHADEPGVDLTLMVDGSAMLAGQALHWLAEAR